MAFGWEEGLNVLIRAEMGGRWILAGVLQVAFSFGLEVLYETGREVLMVYRLCR